MTLIDHAPLAGIGLFLDFLKQTFKPKQLALVKIEIWEFLLLPFYLIIPIFMAIIIPSDKDRRLFSWGLFAKVAGVMGFTGVYLLYYGGGDTTAYFQVASALNKLILQNPSQGLEALFSGYSSEIYSYFNSNTGFPYRYICAANSTYLVSKFVTIFSFAGLNSYMLTSILLACLFFLPAWDFHKTISTFYSTPSRILSVCTLFVPSVLFWGGGISKDSITYASLLLLISCTYWVFLKKRLIVWRIFSIVVFATLITVIKPYIILVFLSSALLWIFYDQITKLSNPILRVIILPTLGIFLIVILSALFGTFSAVLGDYSSEKIIEKAIVSQQDLKRDYYGGNNFDIGTIEPNTVGVLSKFPIATFWGFYGPTVLNVNSAIMLFSAIETTILLFLTISILTFKNPLTTLKYLRSSAFLTFCLVFCVAFAFGIGLSTPNFGALVRFRIPLLPLFSLLLTTIFFRLKIDD